MQLFTGIAIFAALPLCSVAQTIERESTELEPVSIETIEVIATTPIGTRRAQGEVGSLVQVATGEALRRQRHRTIADFMRSNFASVVINEAQSNPLQPDVQYRGFVGSPLLGLPQGIAVYQNGVRINEPFGDTVNWALVPNAAIASATLIPGANPLYGLNALGGAISLETKSGASDPGTTIEVRGGSFGRLGVDITTGHILSEEVSTFISATHLTEDGWRDFSPTNATQMFGNAAWQGAATSLDLNLTAVDTDLIGNGAAPAELLALDREAIFTRPDRTRNNLRMLSVASSHTLTDTLELAANAHVRVSAIDTLNGDESDFAACEETAGFICEEAGDADAAETVATDASGAPIAFADRLVGATTNYSKTDQTGAGFAVQATKAYSSSSGTHLLTLGVTYDSSHIDFASHTELGTLDPTRRAIPGGVVIGASFTELETDASQSSVYLSDSWTIAGATATFSGRYNVARIRLRDQLGSALNGDHDYARFNPALGIAAPLSRGVRFYINYAESNRVPSPVELTCADEDDPCRLPNAFLADPPLRDVVARTTEAGLMGGRPKLSWHLGAFHTVNEDDILFISAGPARNQGYFDNVGNTVRAGIELSLRGTAGDQVDWFVNYTNLSATFEEAFELSSPNNPAASAGEIGVEPGDRLPLLPEHTLKAGARVTFGRFEIGVNAVAASSIHLRGDESNLATRVDGHTLVNLNAEYEVSARIRVFFDVDNLLDSKFETFGLFGDAREVLGDEFDDPRFLTPAAPRAVRFGLRATI